MHALLVMDVALAALACQGPGDPVAARYYVLIFKAYDLLDLVCVTTVTAVPLNEIVAVSRAACLTCLVTLTARN